MTEPGPDDADLAHQRFVEFGELPPRIRPEEYVETVKTGVPPGRPAPAGSEAQNQALQTGG